MTKAKVIIEVEVEELDLFLSSFESGLIAFSEETKANVLKAKVQEIEK